MKLKFQSRQLTFFQFENNLRNPLVAHIFATNWLQNKKSISSVLVQFLPKHTMQIEVFKTNVRTKKNADMIINLIKRIQPVGKINFDLEDCDKILRIEAKEIEVQPILKLLLDLGFTCIPL